MKKFSIPLILTVILSVPAVLWVRSVQWTAPEASAQAPAVDSLLLLEFSILAVITVLVMVYFFYALWAFRRPAGDTGDGEHFHGNTAIEVLWTVIPLIIVVVMGLYGANVLTSLDATSVAMAEDDLEVVAVGQQWVWSFEYPEYDIVSPELMLPVDQPTYFKLTATDVIHSFWVPEFRLKMDAIPGKENALRLTPNKIGVYSVDCAELCGTSHALMVAPAKVVSRAEFDTWVEQQVALNNASPEIRGGRVAQQFACIGCHSIDGSKLVGPTWKGLFGTEEAFVDGGKVVVDEAYLRESIMEPGKHVVEGYADNVMPRDLGVRMNEKQIDDVIEYIKSVK
jgi:cytochrome c oxidase subunit 2